MIYQLMTAQMKLELMALAVNDDTVMR